MTTLAPWNRRQFLGAILAAGVMPRIWVRGAALSRARGTVFHDRDRDGRKGVNDIGLEGIPVSNGRDVVLTDEYGRWELPILDGPATDFFVVKPAGWAVPISSDLLTLHYYIHQPAGSPSQRYNGIKPTGPLPESIDFALTRVDETDAFRVLICGDPQPRNALEVDYLARSTPAAFRAANGALGITLGDVGFDNLNVYPLVNKVFASSGIPWRHVIGNHDLNYDSRTPDIPAANSLILRVFSNF